jgi:hypothetical protein
MTDMLKKRSSLGIAAAIVIAVGYLYFFYLPMEKENKRLSAELSSRRIAVGEAQMLGVDIENARLQLAKTIAHVEDWESRNDDDPAQVLALINDEVQQSGVQTINFDPEKTVQMDTLQKMQLVLGTKGDFQQVYDMLTRIEKLHPTIWIEGFRVGTSQQDKMLSNEISLAIFADNPKNSD